MLRYWAAELPDAEIILGTSNRRPFCKTQAFNRAIRSSHGKVLVLLDADAYMSGKPLERCADRILADPNDHLWFVPYRRLFRLSQAITYQIVHSDPTDPLRLTDPPDPFDIDGDPVMSSYGRRYGAMAMVIPREAFDALGGFDERFRGWGGEDASILRALDTLWGKHKSVNTAIYHLWHPKIGDTHRERRWDGQTKANPNDRLASAYHRANRHPAAMRRLVDEGNKASRHRLLIIIDALLSKLIRKG